MQAGFDRLCMNPPPGTRMMGFGKRDAGSVSDSIHDDIYVRVLYIKDGLEEALIISFDMCFIGREDADRFKGALGRHLDVTPRQILMNATHSHVGPASGWWAYGDYLPPERLYLRDLEAKVIQAARSARAKAIPVNLQAGMGRSQVPMNRRRRMSDGRIENRPNPEGAVCDVLPVLLMKDESDIPVACVFSISAHPSIMGGTAISAEYPGIACSGVDAHLTKDCSLFLQGCGGDAKTSVAGEGRESWRSNDWDVVTQVGDMLSEEVKEVLKHKMQPVIPALKTVLVETNWPLEQADRAEYEHWIKNLIPDAPPQDQGIYELWAERQLHHLDAGHLLPTQASIQIQALQLGRTVRLIAIEGEPVAGHGLHILSYYPVGVTFPIGYTNGEGLYLPTSPQITEGGYEVDSYGEYGYPARLKPGMETIIQNTLDLFTDQGIR